MELEKHHQNEAEIYLCIHQKLDPSIVSKMIDAKFPGCCDPIIRLFKGLDNCIIRSENAKRIISTIITLVKIELKYIDMFKDIGITFLMLDLIGGTQALVDLPTNFGSVIVMFMLASIIIPTILSALNFTNSGDYFLAGSSKLKRILNASRFYLTSPLQPAILEAVQYQNKEKARRWAQDYNKRANTEIKECRLLKKQLVAFIKIELGTK